MHVHLWDRQLRGIFVTNAEPVHFALPQGVRSMSLEHGLFRSGYTLYRCGCGLPVAVPSGHGRAP